MKYIIQKFRTLEKKDQLIFFLVCSTISNFFIGIAIYGMIKYKRNQEPIIKGIKITNFANALTSIVLTQVVLLDTYAKGYDSTLNGYTGMGVSLIIIGLGLYMIICINKDTKVL